MTADFSDPNERAIVVQHIPRLVGTDGGKGLLRAFPPHRGIPNVSVFQTFSHIHPDLTGSSEIVV